MNAYSLIKQDAYTKYRPTIPSQIFWKNTSSNMDKLWKYFYNIDDYPETYLGKVKEMARCICPISGKHQLFNTNILLNKKPRYGSIVTVQSINTPSEIKNAMLVTFPSIIYTNEVGFLNEKSCKNKIYKKDFIFVKWDDDNYYEWRMRSGKILILRQNYINNLLPYERKYLRMHT
jgi:hypothetical protein